jgi:hypothetical protein
VSEPLVGQKWGSRSALVPIVIRSVVRSSSSAGTGE